MNSYKITAPKLKIAITGSTGFVGVHLIHHLLRSGHEIVAIKRPTSLMDEFNLISAYYGSTEVDNSRLSWVDCELFDTQGLIDVIQTCDQLIHAAGYISYNSKDRRNLMEVNQRYTENVVNACLEADIQQLVYLSSTAAVGKKDNGDLVVESNEWDMGANYSQYGLSKHLGEMEVWRGREEGLDVCVFNPGVVLGFGDWSKGSLKLFKQAANGFPFYSEGITGFVGVEDLCEVISRCIQTPGLNQRFIMISENRTYRSVNAAMAEALGRRPANIGVKGGLYRSILVVMWMKKLLGMSGMLSVETTKAAVSVNYFSNEAARETFGFTFTSIDEVIQKAASAYNKNSPPR